MKEIVWVIILLVGTIIGLVNMDAGVRKPLVPVGEPMHHLVTVVRDVTGSDGALYYDEELVVSGRSITIEDIESVASERLVTVMVRRVISPPEDGWPEINTGFANEVGL